MEATDKKVIDIPLKRGSRADSKCPPLEQLAELYAHYTAAEIAEILGVKEATVRSWVARARKRYREYAAMEAAAQKG